MYLITLLITSHHAHSLDEGMTRVVHSSLNALVKTPVIRGQLVPQTAIDRRGQSSSHAVVVFAQVWVVSTWKDEEQMTLNCFWVVALDKKIFSG